MFVTFALQIVPKRLRKLRSSIRKTT